MYSLKVIKKMIYSSTNKIKNEDTNIQYIFQVLQIHSLITHRLHVSNYQKYNLFITRRSQQPWLSSSWV